MECEFFHILEYLKEDIEKKINIARIKMITACLKYIVYFFLNIFISPIPKIYSIPVDDI